MTRAIFVYEAKDIECPAVARFTARVWHDGQPMPVTFYASSYVDAEEKARLWWDDQIEAERRKAENLEAARQRIKKRGQE